MSYQAVITSLSEFKAVNTHIKDLGKLKLGTEDLKLGELLGRAIQELQNLYLQTRVKSTPMDLVGSTAFRITPLVAYCRERVTIGQPEWQVLALRHGWTPPQSS